MERFDTPLAQACLHLARQVLWKTTGASTDVTETLAGKFLDIAEDHQDLVRQVRENDHVIEHAVRYLADVHAIPPMGTDTSWFRDSLEVLIELAVPNRGLTPEAAKLMPCLQQGIAESLADVPVSRSEVRIEDEDAQLLEFLQEAGCQYGCVSDLLDLIERLYHGDPLADEDRRFMMLAAMAAPLTRNARKQK